MPNRSCHSEKNGYSGRAAILGPLAVFGLAAGLLGACASDAGSEGAASGMATHGDFSASAVGLSYAREACASCHAVELGEMKSPMASAPAFQSLADRPDMSRQALGALLLSPHRTMPNLIVAPDRVDDLAAYLAALGNGE